MKLIVACAVLGLLLVQICASPVSSSTSANEKLDTVIDDAVPPVVSDNMNKTIVTEKVNTTSLVAMKRTKKSHDATNTVSAAAPQFSSCGQCTGDGADQFTSASFPAHREFQDHHAIQMAQYGEQHQFENNIGAAYGYQGHSHEPSYGGHGAHADKPAYHDIDAGHGGHPYQPAGYQGYHDSENHASGYHEDYHHQAAAYHHPPSYQPSYHSPEHQAPAHQPPTYQAPEYHAPANHKPAYHKPANHKPTYDKPEYHKPAYHAPAYQPEHQAPDYDPTYSSPAYDMSSVIYTGPYRPQSQSYSYPTSVPEASCGSNLLIGCSPTVQQVPCGGYGAQPYPVPAFNAPAPSPTYREAIGDDVEMKSPKPDSDIKSESDKDKVTAKSNIESSTNTSVTTEATKPTNEKTKEADARQRTAFESAVGEPQQQKQQQQSEQQQQPQSMPAPMPTSQQQQQHDDATQKQKATMMKMAQMAQKMESNKNQPINSMVPMAPMPTQHQQQAMMAAPQMQGFMPVAGGSQQASYFQGSSFKP